MHVVRICHTRHLSVQAQIGGAGWRGADRARETRGAERPEEHGIIGVLREQAVRPAVAEGEDGLDSGGVADLHHPLGDVVERFVPRHTTEGSLPLRTLPDRRVEQSIIPVHALAETAHLCADVVPCDGIGIATIDLDHAALFDGDVERAGIRAI